MMRNLTFVPYFPGFYNSIFESEFDIVAGQMMEELEEIHHETVGSDNTDTEGFDSYQTDIAERYCELVAAQLSEFTGIKVEISLNRIASPRFYNFETDRVEGWIEEYALPLIYAVTDRAILARLVDERHSSRSGFHSFYSGNFGEDWEPRDVRDWDANEVETLLAAAIETHRGRRVESEDEFAAELFEDVGESIYGIAFQHCNVTLKNTEKAA